MSGSHPPYPDELARQRRRLVGKGWRMEEDGPKADDDRKNGGLHRMYSHRSWLANGHKSVQGTVSRPRLLLRIALVRHGNHDHDISCLPYPPYHTYSRWIASIALHSFRKAHGGTFSLHLQHGSFTNLQARRFSNLQRRLDGWSASSAHLQVLIA
ncbi:hypothetical protein B0T13DRAFT_226411 [Neurospora crassa]|nr:hypothetical protein B0T13DRAFT_226411 [Neurospora crassa]